MLISKPRYLNDVIQTLSQYTEDQIIDVIRWLMDHGKVIRGKDEMLGWHDQLNISFE